jgi:copper(I)-binding protein
MMLINAARLEVGDTVDVTLVWETAGDMTIVAEVVEPGDTTGEAP